MDYIRKFNKIKGNAPLEGMNFLETVYYADSMTKYIMLKFFQRSCISKLISFKILKQKLQ